MDSIGMGKALDDAGRGCRVGIARSADGDAPAVDTGFPDGADLGIRLRRQECVEVVMRGRTRDFKHAVAAGIMAPIGNHSLRATGITAYLSNGGTLEHAQTMAAHESPRTTKLYDRTKDRLTLDEIERIVI
jgi:hypothetical protein